MQYILPVGGEIPHFVPQEAEIQHLHWTQFQRSPLKAVNYQLISVFYLLKFLSMITFSPWSARGFAFWIFGRSPAFACKDSEQLFKSPLPASPSQDCCSWTPSSVSPGWRHNKPRSRWSQEWRSLSIGPVFLATSTSSTCRQSPRRWWRGGRPGLTSRANGTSWGMLGKALPGIGYQLI